MIRISFNLMAVGVVLALVFVSYSGYDLFPDPLGHFLLALGAAQVRHLAPNFRTAAIVAGPLIPMSICEYLDPIDLEEIALLGLMPTLVSVGLFAVLWQLATGVRVASLRNFQEELARRAEAVRWMLLYLFGGYLFTLTVSMMSETLAGACAILTAVIVAFMAVMMALLLHRAGDVLGEPPSDSLPLTVADPA